MEMQARNRVLLVDDDNVRRETRVRLLEAEGYQVQTRTDHVAAEREDHEGHFDLLIIALHAKKLEDAAAYSERIRKNNPTLPILLLTDYGVYAPRSAKSEKVETGAPDELMEKVASMIAGSTHIRQF